MYSVIKSFLGDFLFVCTNSNGSIENRAKKKPIAPKAIGSKEITLLLLLLFAPGLQLVFKDAEWYTAIFQYLIVERSNVEFISQ